MQRVPDSAMFEKPVFVVKKRRVNIRTKNLMCLPWQLRLSGSFGVLPDVWWWQRVHWLGQLLPGRCP